MKNDDFNIHNTSAFALRSGAVVQHLLDITSRDERAPAEMKVDIAMIENHL